MSSTKQSSYITPQFLTKYEVASLIGVRVEQLAFGSPSLLNEEELQSCSNNIEAIATLELKLKKLPFKIARTLPNNTQEILSIKNLIVI